MTHGACFVQVILVHYLESTCLDATCFVSSSRMQCVYIQYVRKTCILFSFQTVSLCHCQHVSVNDFCGSFLSAVQMRITFKAKTLTESQSHSQIDD